MTQYYFGKLDLLQVCNVTDEEAVLCLIGRLMGHTLKNGTKAERYEIPEQLYAEYLSTLPAEMLEPRDTRGIL
jgi:hypothetical protein